MLTRMAVLAQAFLAADAAARAVPAHAQGADERTPGGGLEAPAYVVRAFPFIRRVRHAHLFARSYVFHDEYPLSSFSRLRLWSFEPAQVRVPLNTARMSSSYGF